MFFLGGPTATLRDISIFLFAYLYWFNFNTSNPCLCSQNSNQNRDFLMRCTDESIWETSTDVITSFFYIIHLATYLVKPHKCSIYYSIFVMSCQLLVYIRLSTIIDTTSHIQSILGSTTVIDINFLRMFKELKHLQSKHILVWVMFISAWTNVHIILIL